ncbi:MAG: DUF6069 family protein [Dehalococcoidia bacterium]
MTTDVQSHTTLYGYRFRSLLIGGLVTAAVAAVANLVVFMIAKGPLDISFVIAYRGPDTTPESLPPALVAITSAVPALIAALLLWVLGHTIRRPLFVFQIVSAIALLLSLAGPFTLEDVSASTRVALLVMHLLAGAIIIGGLTLWVSQGPQEERISA